MAILIYRHSFSNSLFQNKVTDQLSPNATINLGGGFLSSIVAFDITSTNAEDTDGTNLDPFMQDLGFTRITAAGAKILDEVIHWGSFDVNDAPTSDVTAGDLGHSTNGDGGSEGPCYYDGTNWINNKAGSIYAGLPIDTTGGGIDFASITNSGSYTGAAGLYSATQASTSGTGSGAEFTVRLDGTGLITEIIKIDNPGSGYAANDTVTLSVSGPTENTAAVLTVNLIG